MNFDYGSYWTSYDYKADCENSIIENSLKVI